MGTKQVSGVAATIGPEGTVTIPAEVLAEANLSEGSVVKLCAAGDGAIAIVSEARDPEQWWFWTDEWQAREREADEELKSGRATEPLSGDEFLALLKAEDETAPR